MYARCPGRVPAGAGAVGEVGTLTALFLNAGVDRPAALDACDEAAFDDAFAVNTKGQFFTLVKTLPLLSDGASVIVTVGIGGDAQPDRQQSHSWVTRRAADHDTPMMRAAPGLGSGEVAAMLAGMAASNPFGRLGRPEDIAETVAFLASDGAAYITGQEITVSGGAGLAV